MTCLAHSDIHLGRDLGYQEENLVSMLLKKRFFEKLFPQRFGKNYVINYPHLQDITIFHWLYLYEVDMGLPIIILLELTCVNQKFCFKHVLKLIFFNGVKYVLRIIFVHNESACLVKRKVLPTKCRVGEGGR